jgi:hypothetical protein
VADLLTIEGLFTQCFEICAAAINKAETTRKLDDSFKSLDSTLTSSISSSSSESSFTETEKKRRKNKESEIIR